MAVQALARALNEANGMKSTLPYWKGLLRDLGVTLLFMTLVPLSLFLPFIESGCTGWYRQQVRLMTGKGGSIFGQL